MAKLTKAEAKAHKQACELLMKDRLTEDDKEFVYRNWHEGAAHVNSSAGAFFTPFEMAFDVAIDIYGTHIIDLCAGIGILSYAAWCRSAWGKRRARITCIERNPDYVAVGKKLLPEATWICADVLDILDMGLGRFECAVSNPPFGGVQREGRQSPGYSGTAFEYHVIDIASRLADHGTFIVPQMSAGFRYSGARNFERDKEGKAVEFQKGSGLHFDIGCGVDTEFYRKSWKGVSPLCEIVYVDFIERRSLAANDNQPAPTQAEQPAQCDLFGRAA